MILSPVITRRGYQLADVVGVQLLSMHSNGARERFTFSPVTRSTARAGQPSQVFTFLSFHRFVNLQ
jgi:hypothetical protein